MLQAEDLRGTRSEKNVLEAFAAESQAISRYSYFAEQARKLGNEGIAQLFETMARNEREHARQWFRLMGEEMGGEIGDCLRLCAEKENGEWKSFYPRFAEDAREEGFEMLAVLFEKVAAIENDHEKRFLEAYAATAAGGVGTVIKRPEDSSPVRYRCASCGDVEDTPLPICPVCNAEGSFQSEP